ncbi:fungal-specific transcription factor domain-containing protein [Aspergillus ambiguus]|uniref:transcription factor domain-containing protein n=1 Tax=Aspergillus ambiguus TaxID=176160 RepID=UPI003CCD57D4
MEISGARDATPRLHLSSQVCDRCRMKKIRCDGLLPSCSNCKASDASCITSKQLKRRTRPRRHLELQERLLDELRVQNENLQREIQQLRSSHSTNINTSIWSDTSPGSPAPNHQMLQFTASFDTATTVHEQDQPVIKHLGRLVPSSPSVNRFAGSTTGIYFIRCAETVHKSLFNHEEGFPEVVNRLHLLGPSPEYFGPRHLLSPANLSQPPHFIFKKPRAYYLHGLTDFFQSWISIWPILMKKQFFSHFHRIFDLVETHDPNLSPSDFAILRQIFLVLSISAWQSRSPKECDLYYTNALECAQTTTVPENGDLPGLQSLLLTCLYLQLTRKHEEWIQISGQAVRLAQSLGLHRHSRRFRFCAGEVELRKRIWWCVYAVDIACSIVHGLPKIIQDDDVDTDLPIDTDLDDVTTADIPLPLPGEKTSMATFIAYATLLRILSSCLKSLYTTTKRRNGVAKITALDHELSVWRYSVFQFKGSEMQKNHDVGLLDTSHMNSRDQSFETLFLHLLSNVAVVLVHQPALTFDPKHPQFIKSLSKCVGAALNILSLLGNSHYNQRLHYLLPNKSSIVFQSTLMCFYHQWMCTSFSLTPSHNLNPLMEKIAGIALKLLDMHKAELVDPNTGSNANIDIQTISAAEDLVRLFSSRLDRARHISMSPELAFSTTQRSPASLVPTHPTDPVSHAPGAGFEQGSPTATTPLDFGILDQDILDFDWF